jgi:hypothetical protein
MEEKETNKEHEFFECIRLRNYSCPNEECRKHLAMGLSDFLYPREFLTRIKS